MVDVEEDGELFYCGNCGGEHETQEEAEECCFEQDLPDPEVEGLEDFEAGKEKEKS